MTSDIAARTRVLALIGNPVAHSSSPTIQNAAMRDLGLDGVYVALRANWEEMVGFVRGLVQPLLGCV